MAAPHRNSTVQEPIPVTPGEPKRRPELDGIRGLAILMVMCFHYLSVPLIESGHGWAMAAGKSMRLFWSGVDLFFVLSGFLIGGILLKQRQAVNYYTVFFVRRCCRIWPLYYFLLAIFILVAKQVGGQPGTEALDPGPVPLWSYFVFAQNILMSIHHHFGADWLTVTWSLAVEEQFYLVLPFMVRLLPNRQLVYTAACGIVAVVLLRMFFSRDFLVYVSAPTRADSVLAGLLLAVGMSYPGFRSFLDRHASLLMLMVAFGVAGMAGLTFNHRLLGEGLHLWTAMVYSGLIALLALGRPAWLYKLVTQPWLQFVGIISYGFYLFHAPAIWTINRWLPESVGAQYSPTRILVAAAGGAVLTLLVSVICYFSFERSFVRLGHRLRYEH